MPDPRLHVVSVLTTRETGGAEYAGVELLGALVRRGHTAKLFTNLTGLAEGSEVSTEAIEIGPKLRRSTVVPVLAGLPLWTLRLARALRRERDRTGPIDVLLVHFKKEQLMASLLPRRLTGGIAWAEWGPLPAAFTRGVPRLLYRLAARRAEAILAVSESTRRSLLEAGIPDTKITVVPNRLDPNRVRFDAAGRARLRSEWGADDGTFVVGCMGRLHRKKRVHVLIESLSHLNGNGVLLVLAGDGDEERNLRRLAAEHSGAVRFVPTPGANPQSVLSAFDVALFAAAPTEGAPQSIVLAQLTGRPVIATDRPGAEECIVPGTGMIADPAQDPRALAACIEAYRGDPERREREGQAARRFAAERHDQRKIDADVEELLTRVAATNAARA